METKRSRGLRKLDGRAVARGALLSVIAGTLALLAWGLSTRMTADPASLLEQEAVPDPAVPVRMTGLSYKTYRKERLVSVIEAGEFKIHPRPFWGFRVKPYQEAVLRDVSIKLYVGDQHEDLSSIHLLPILAADPDPSVKKAIDAHASGQGVITRGIIEQLTVDVLKDGRIALVLAATRSAIDLKQKRLVMSDVLVHRPSIHQVIRSQTAVWDQASLTLAIPAYVMETEGKTVSGRNLTIALGALS
jgi:hypothetical protein